jgi:hypothetical protein
VSLPKKNLRQEPLAPPPARSRRALRQLVRQVDRGNERTPGTDDAAVPLNADLPVD